MSGPAPPTTIALHGAAAAVHDYHAGRTGSFDEAIAAIRAARQAGGPVTVTTAVTRSSYRVLSALPPLLHAHGVAAWRLTLARHGDHEVATSAAADAGPTTAADRWVPRLAMALPFALHAIDRAVRLGLDAAIIDAPRCLLGPFAARGLVEERRAFPAPCARCAARPACAGVDAAYVDRFGAGELTPQP